MSSKIIKGRLYEIGANDYATPIASSEDEAKNWKSNPSDKPADYVVRNDKVYEVVEPKNYVDSLMDNNAKLVAAEKSACVIARKGVPGEKIQVYTANGNLEATEVCGENKWIVTRADLDGNPVIDDYGHRNTWQISDETFKKKYDVEHMTENGFVKPNGGKQDFIQVDKDIAVMVPWGENRALIPQTIDAGGYLNITNKEKIYGIANSEFDDTYRVVDEIKVVSLSDLEGRQSLPDDFYGYVKDDGDFDCTGEYFKMDKSKSNQSSREVPFVANASNFDFNIGSRYRNDSIDKMEPLPSELSISEKRKNDAEAATHNAFIVADRVSRAASVLGIDYEVNDKTEDVLGK